MATKKGFKYNPGQESATRHWIPILVGLTVPIMWLIIAGWLFPVPVWYFSRVLLCSTIGGFILSIMWLTDDIQGSARPGLWYGLVIVGVILPVLLVIGGSMESSDGADDRKNSASENGKADKPFPKKAIDGDILRHALSLEWKQTATSNTFPFYLSKGDVDKPVFLEQNFALMEDGEFWWNITNYSENLRIRVGDNPFFEDGGYASLHSKQGKGSILHTTALYGVVSVNERKLKLYGDKIRPLKPVQVTTGGSLPRRKQGKVSRVALTQLLDPASQWPCSKVPAGFYSRVHVRFADEEAHHLSADTMDRPIDVDSSGSAQPQFPGFYLQGEKDKDLIFIPMGGRYSPNANGYTYAAEAEISSLDPKWPKDQEVVVGVVTPAHDGLVRADVVFRVEPQKNQP